MRPEAESFGASRGSSRSRNTWILGRIRGTDLRGQMPRGAPRRAPILCMTMTMALLSLLAFASPAWACPNCAEGRQARTQVWRDDFLHNFLVALLPFLLVGAISVRANAIGRSGASQENSGDPAETPEGINALDSDGISRRPST